MALPASVRLTENFFQNRTEIAGLLLDFLHHLFRLPRNPDDTPGRSRLRSFVPAFCVVHNLTNRLHKANLHPIAAKFKPDCQKYYSQIIHRRGDAITARRGLAFAGFYRKLSA